MKNRVLPLVLLFQLVFSTATAVAALDQDAAEETVLTMLAAGISADAIIDTLVADGRSLRAATTVAVDAADIENKVDLARAGICASLDTTQAGIVGERVLGVVRDESLANEVRTLVAEFSTGGCEPPQVDQKVSPSVYDGENTTSGGAGVSPSN